MDDRHRELAAETLEMLEQQIQEETINFTLTRALIANLRPYDVFNHFRSDLAEVFDVELI